MPRKPARSTPCPWCERLRQSGGWLRLHRGSSPNEPTRSLSVWRLLGLLVLGGLALQVYFVVRVAMLVVVDPASTSFERSNLWRLAITENSPSWQQSWTPYERISDHLKRAVIASEDSRFTEHTGVEWDAIERAWERNTRLMEAAAERAEANRPVRPVRIHGGSTITQQLAKNLWLSSERNLPRKGQELMLAKLLELTLSKQRILEIYLNHVEWGNGVFGAEAAARRHFNKSASALTAPEAARLAVMLPRPRFFEERPQSAYLRSQSKRILARMRHVSLPD